MFGSQRNELVETRQTLARAGFIYTGQKYIHTNDPIVVQNYLQSADLGAPRQTRRRRSSEVGFFATLVMMFGLVHAMGGIQYVLSG